MSPASLRTQLALLTLDVPHIDVPSTHFFGADHVPRQAAVMIPLCALATGEPAVVLTRRARHLSTHAGEYSFPGGSVDPQDRSLLDAALRECEEEIAIPADALDVIGFLASVPTLSDFQIAAFVATFDHATPMRADPGEVERIVIIPLAELTATGVHRVRIETHGSQTLPIHAYHLDPEQPIWGATAYLLHALIELFGLKYA